MIRKIYELDRKRLEVVNRCLNSATIRMIGVWPLTKGDQEMGTIWFEREPTGMLVFHFIAEGSVGTFRIGEGFGICDFEEGSFETFADFAELMGLREVKPLESVDT